jgi:hypothetical protein
MHSSIQININGSPDSDYAVLSVLFLHKNEQDEYQATELYRGRHIAQGLGNGMAIEPWALATIAQHTDTIKAALADYINRGSKTLLSDVPLSKGQLCSGARPAAASRR